MRLYSYRLDEVFTSMSLLGKENNNYKKKNDRKPTDHSFLLYFVSCSVVAQSFRGLLVF